MQKKGRIVVSIGDPAGIGPEISLKSFLVSREDISSLSQKEVSPVEQHNGKEETPRVVLVGDSIVLQAVIDRLGLPLYLEEICLEEIDNTEEHGNAEKTAVPFIDTGSITDISQLQTGKVSALSGKASGEYVRKAVELCMKGEAEGLVTAPLNKEAIRASGNPYIGHTEMISALTNGNKGVTMFSVDNLKIFFHSRHLSLADALSAIDAESVRESLETAAHCLASIGLTAPSIALAALNPHASDGGLFGDEETEFLLPAVKEARRGGLNVDGPVPADSVFSMALRGRFDAVLSLYHDQGHIAAKTYDFYRTVSMTFGYPFLRTSVDHGTAFDIAWKGSANPISMHEAISTCRRYAHVYSKKKM